MSFKQTNSQSRWDANRNKMSFLFEPLININLTNLREQDFEDYLKIGINKNFSVKLNELKNEDFLALETLVNGWFDFQEILVTFHSERVKRFNRYG